MTLNCPKQNPGEPWLRRPDSSYSGSLWFGTLVDICEGGSYHIDNFVEGTRVRCQSLSQGRGIEFMLVSHSYGVPEPHG